MGVGDNDSLKVYVRLPVRIKEELQIKDLHPDIETVKLPRQKSTRWCFIIFEEQEKLDRVVKHLEETLIDGKKIVVKPFRHRLPRTKVRTLLATTESDGKDRLQLFTEDDH